MTLLETREGIRHTFPEEGNVQDTPRVATASYWATQSRKKRLKACAPDVSRTRLALQRVPRLSKDEAVAPTGSTRLASGSGQCPGAECGVIL